MKYQTTAKIDYLDFIIDVTLPDPNEDNTIFVAILRKEGTYNPESYSNFLRHFQFSGESNDFNKWLLEALDAAIGYMAGYGHRYASSPDYKYKTSKWKQATIDDDFNSNF